MRSLRPLTPQLTVTFLSFFGTLLIGCGLEAPQTPRFETTLFLPISAETYTGIDMAGDLEAVEGDSTEAGLLSIRLSDELEPMALEKGLQFEIASRTHEATLEEIDWQMPLLDTLAYRVADLIPGVIPPGGIEMPVDSFSYTPDPRDLGTFDDFEEIRLSAGTLQLTLVNRFPVPIGGPGEGREVIIRVDDHSVSPEREVARFTIGQTIPAGGTYVDEFDLSGAAVGNHLSLRLSGWCPGSGGEIVLVSPEDELALELTFRDCDVSYLRGNAPSLELQIAESIALDENLRVDEAVVGSGQVRWYLQSGLPVTATLWLRLPQVRRGDGAVEFTEILAPHGSAVLEADLAGAIVAGEALTELTCEIEVITDSSLVTCEVALGQGISADLAASQLVFDYVSGPLGPLSVALDPTDIEIEFPPEVDGVTFAAAEAVLEIENRTQAPIEAQLSLSGATAGDTVVVAFTAQIPPSSGRDTAHVRVTLNEANSAILELANQRPEEAWFGGSIIAGDGVSDCTVHAADFLEGSYTIQVPMKMVLDTARHDGEPFELEIDDSARKRIAENLREVDLNATVENHFPTAVQVRFHFAESAGALFVNDEFVLEANQIPAAPVDPLTGRVTAAEISSLTLRVTGDEIDFFTRPSVYGAVEVVLSGAGEESFEIWTTDYVTIRGVAEFLCLIH